MRKRGLLQQLGWVDSNLRILGEKKLHCSFRAAFCAIRLTPAKQRQGNSSQSNASGKGVIVLVHQHCNLLDSDSRLIFSILCTFTLWNTGILVRQVKWVLLHIRHCPDSDLLKTCSSPPNGALQTRFDVKLCRPALESSFSYLLSQSEDQAQPHPHRTALIAAARFLLLLQTIQGRGLVGEKQQRPSTRSTRASGKQIAPGCAYCSAPVMHHPAFWPTSWQSSCPQGLPVLPDSGRTSQPQTNLHGLLLFEPQASLLRPTIFPTSPILVRSRQVCGLSSTTPNLSSARPKRRPSWHP